MSFAPSTISHSQHYPALMVRQYPQHHSFFHRELDQIWISTQHPPLLMMNL